MAEPESERKSGESPDESDATVEADASADDADVTADADVNTDAKTGDDHAEDTSGNRDDAHLRDVEPGAGCTEIWEHLSETRDE